MAKFKVGDRVRRVTRSTWPEDFGHLGQEYTIQGFKGDHLVIFDGCDGASPGAFELVPTITIESGKHYRLRNGKVTGRVTTGDIGFEAIVDGQVKVFDKAGGAVFGGEDIVEAWVPKVGERVSVVYGHGWNGEGEVTGTASKYFVVMLKTGTFAGTSGGFTLQDLEPLLVAAPAQPAVLTIQQGKFYKTRDGRKVGPMRWSSRGNLWATADGFDNDHWYTQNNVHFAKGYINTRIGAKTPDDLVALWVDEPVAVAASNDNVAKPKFKVGDRVRVVAAGDAWQEKYKGTTFTIDSDEGDFDGDRSWSGRDHASPYRWKESQLELVPVVVPPAIVALIEDGAAKPSSKPKVHASQADAADEAERLALAHPGQLFGVFVLADSKIADVVNVPTPVLRAA